MPSIRETYHAFEGFIDQQKKSIDRITAEQSLVREQLSDAREVLMVELRKLCRDLSPSTLARFDKAAVKAGLYRSFTELKIHEDVRNTDFQLRIDRVQKNFGPSADIAGSIDALGDRHLTQKALLDEKTRELSGLDRKLQPLSEFNHSVSRKLTPETLDYYKSFSPLRFFDSTWHWGRHLIKSYERKNGTPLMDDAVRFDNISSEKALLQKDVSSLEAELSGLKSAFGEIQLCRSELRTPDQIKAIIQSAIAENLIGSSVFADAVSDGLNRESATDLKTAVLKVGNLTKMQDKLADLKTQADATLSRLEAPMYKLRQGMYRAGYKTISIDLSSIEKAVGNTAEYSAFMTQNSSLARQSISSFSSSQMMQRPDDGLLTMQNFLLFYMLTNFDADPGYLHHSFGMDAAAMAQVNSDINVDMPSSDINLSDSFNAVDMPSLDTGVDTGLNTGFDVPSIDVPSFEMPSFDMPSFDIPSIDISIDMGSSFSSDFSSSFN